MPGKVDPIKQAAENFGDEVDDWTGEFKVFLRQTKDVKAPRRYVAQIKERYEMVIKTFRGLKKADPNYKTNYPTAEETVERISDEYGHFY